MRLLLSVTGLALDTLREHKLRSFLTVLGVIIGTGTIIGVGSILAGLDSAVTGVIRAMGANTAIVFKVRMGPNFGGRTPEERGRKPLTYEDAVAIAERCPAVENVSPYLLPPNVFQRAGPGFSTDRARYRGADYFGPQVAGSTERYAASAQVEMLSGRFFTGAEDLHRLPVAAIGEDIYRALFGVEDAIGKIITVDGHEVEVIGVMRRPTASLPGQEDNRILMPYFTMHKMFAAAQENLLMVQAKDGQLAEAMDELRVVLRQRRHVAFSAPDNFYVSKIGRAHV